MTAGAPDEDLVRLVRVATHRLLGAATRLGDAELVQPAASGLGTRRHVVARMIRRARRVAAGPGDDAAALLASDRLLQATADELSEALSTSLAAVIARLEDGGLEDDASGADHLAWLELTHVDLAVGYLLQDVPDASMSAVGAHLERSRSEGDSPFSLLFAPRGGD